KIEDQLRAQKIAEILMWIFMGIGLVLSVALGPIAAGLARILAAVLEALGMGITAAARIGTFVAGVIVYGALSVVLDFSQLAIVDAVGHTPFQPTWVDGFMIGLGAFAGGLMPGVSAAKIAEEMANLGKIPRPSPFTKGGTGMTGPTPTQIPRAEGGFTT